MISHPYLHTYMAVFFITSSTKKIIFKKAKILKIVDGKLIKFMWPCLQLYILFFLNLDLHTCLLLSKYDASDFLHSSSSCPNLVSWTFLDTSHSKQHYERETTNGYLCKHYIDNIYTWITPCVSNALRMNAAHFLSMLVKITDSCGKSCTKAS